MPLLLLLFISRWERWRRSRPFFFLHEELIAKSRVTWANNKRVAVLLWPSGDSQTIDIRNWTEKTLCQLKAKRRNSPEIWTGSGGRGRGRGRGLELEQSFVCFRSRRKKKKKKMKMKERKKLRAAAGWNRWRGDGDRSVKKTHPLKDYKVCRIFSSQV